mgnify:CR=1 FL=1
MITSSREAAQKLEHLLKIDKLNPNQVEEHITKAIKKAAPQVDLVSVILGIYKELLQLNLPEILSKKLTLAVCKAIESKLIDKQSMAQAVESQIYQIDPGTLPELVGVLSLNHLKEK